MPQTEIWVDVWDENSLIIGIVQAEPAAMPPELIEPAMVDGANE